ncbi:tetratricopeptide repeat-containing sensor histidine kinase [Limibacter armeniacum]|uniref:tetratricopeptide repeat-containing sensor histidine kinase n=1 Tax=Limibacter armeniacum TaxID=466084 RepID=UPI002FE56C42
MIRIILFVTFLVSVFSFHSSAQTFGKPQNISHVLELIDQKYFDENSELDSLVKVVETELETSSTQLKPLYQLGLGTYLLRHTQEHKQAKELLLSSYNHKDNLPDSLKQYEYEMLDNLGLVYMKLINHDSTKWAYEQALKYLDPEKEKSRMAVLYIKLGGLAMDGFQNMELSKEFYQKAAKLRPFCSGSDTLLVDWHIALGFGRYHFNKQNLDSSEIYFEDLLQTAQKMPITQNKDYVESMGYSYLANIAFDQGKYNEALKYDLLSLELELRNSSPLNLIASYNNLGDDYMLINKQDSAFYYYQLALNLSEEYQSADRKIEVLNNLHEFYAKVGKTKKAYETLLEKNEIEDTLRLHRNNLKYNELLRQYEAEKQEKEIQDQKDQIDLLTAREQLSSLRLTILIVVVVAVLLLGFLYARYRLAIKERKARELEVIGRFKESMTGMIAHDLKNPLSVILGMESEKPSTKQMAKQMLQLVNNMLDVQKFENAEVQLNLEDFSLTALVSEVIEQVRPLLSEKNVTIIPKVESAVGVRADREMIFRVLVNFLTNAIKFSPNNSTIEIEVVQVEKKVEISIHDYGTGIEKSKVAEIFNAYTQVDARKSGGVASTGLGLSFCKLAVEAHGSTILVDSELGKGTSFTFSLPESEEIVDHEKLTESYNEFLVTEMEKGWIQDKLPQLKALKLYQAFEIEEVLEDLEQHKSATIDRWSKEVLDAAYANNREHYDELLRKVSQN